MRLFPLRHCHSPRGRTPSTGNAGRPAMHTSPFFPFFFLKTPDHWNTVVNTLAVTRQTRASPLSAYKILPNSNPGLHEVTRGGYLCTSDRWPEEATSYWQQPHHHGHAPETKALTAFTPTLHKKTNQRNSKEQRCCA